MNLLAAMGAYCFFAVKPEEKEDVALMIASAISHILSVNLSRFNVGIGHGQNREWEVGHKSPYDDLDTKMSGTRVSM